MLERRGKMQEKTTHKIWNVWSSFYDLFWSLIVHRRMPRAIERMRIRPGEHVLDIGIGTGVGLTHYPSHGRVTGIDLAEGMLRRARRRVLKKQMNWVDLALGNALAGLSFGYFARQFAPPMNFALGLALLQIFFIPAGLSYYQIVKTSPKDIAEVRQKLSERAADRRRLQA